ncbi:dihydrofolate reductase-like [Anneissia japonica]|uniref:dihydrofolate reductase-like n=1 Tax=Anneissia japonica TaxID=1529436 RepID=UPI001425501B|nr:dihydrofolate reductase-like [Anneissia japonica]
MMKSVTSVKDNSRRNAVIFGRKTMVTDAECSNPFPNTISIVLSRKIKEMPPWTDYLCHSLEEALSLVNGKISNQIESVWIIGGAEVYKFGSTYCDYIYLTRIFADFNCDTVFPEIDWSQFVKFRDPEVDDAEQTENNGIKFQFEIYRRK